MKLIFSSNKSWSIYNFRSDLLNNLKESGFEIYCIADKDDYSQKLVDSGFHFIENVVGNNQKNPINDILLLFRYYKLYKSVDPDIILHNAIKPNIYGTIAAGMLKIPVINNISGLGTLFIQKSLSTTVAKKLYQISQKFASIVFFQNQYDRQLFIENKLVDEQKCRIIPGSGVDTNKFSPGLKKMRDDGNFRFLFVGRLLRDKGVYEYVQAALQFKKTDPGVSCWILGDIYTENETAISNLELDEWIKKETIIHVPHSDNVAQIMAECNCVVLPSYREGLSKVLIEAASMGLPIVTCNVPGCKDVVTDNENGYLCAPKDWKDLYAKMRKMRSLPHHKYQLMSASARLTAVERFDIKIVIDIYKEQVLSILKESEQSV